MLDGGGGSMVVSSVPQDPRCWARFREMSQSTATYLGGCQASSDSVSTLRVIRSLSWPKQGTQVTRGSVRKAAIFLEERLKSGHGLWSYLGRKMNLFFITIAQKMMF